jgi:hypothetical protein
MRYSQVIDLIHKHKPQSIIEIGTHHGQRAWNMCIAALRYNEVVNYLGFDLFDGATDETNAREMNGKGCGSLRKAQEAMRQITAVHPEFISAIIKGDTRETLHGKSLVADFVFIDGGHSVETIRGDYEAVKGSKVIVFDDYYLSGADTTKFGCNEVVKDLPHEILPKVDRFGELSVQMVKVTNA